MLIIVSRDHPKFCESLKPAQEAKGRDRVILDRRVADRRRRERPVRFRERRRQERRATVSDAERALMKVLGFSVLHPVERAAAARRPATPIRTPESRARARAAGRARGTAGPLRRATG